MATTVHQTCAALCDRKGCRSLRDGFAGCPLRSARPSSEPTNSLGLLKAQDCCGESDFSPYPAWTPCHEESKNLVRDGQVAAVAPGPGKLRGLAPTGSLQAGDVLWKAKPRPGEWKLISCPQFLQHLVRWFKHLSNWECGLDHSESSGRNEAESLAGLHLAQPNLLSEVLG